MQLSNDDTQCQPCIYYGKSLVDKQMTCQYLYTTFDDIQKPHVIMQ
jgi:hypothetical protein